MKLKIDKLYKRQVNTRTGGTTVVYDIYSSGSKFSCWSNKTSDQWYEGQVLDLPDSYITQKPDYNGKKQYQISFPKPSFNNQNNYQQPVANNNSEIIEILRRIDQKLDLIGSHMNGFNSIPESKPEPKNELDKIFEEEIPF